MHTTSIDRYLQPEFGFYARKSYTPNSCLTFNCWFNLSGCVWHLKTFFISDVPKALNLWRFTWAIPILAAICTWICNSDPTESIVTHHFLMQLQLLYYLLFFSFEHIKFHFNFSKNTQRIYCIGTSLNISFHLHDRCGISTTHDVIEWISQFFKSCYIYMHAQLLI